MMILTIGNHTLELISTEQARQMVKDETCICYDNTKLVAINTCPTWGILRYAHHRTETSGARVMAIDAGSACHDYFAALRIWHLRTEYKNNPIILTKIGLHATKLFGSVRYGESLSAAQDSSDTLSNAISFSLPLLFNSGFYDSPTDRRRTMANLEQACLSYTSRYLMSEMPILMDSERNIIGVEISFCILFRNKDTQSPEFIYTGRIDGLHNYNSVPYIAENKTAYRLDDTWRMMFHTSTQVTGYMIAATLLLDRQINDGFIMGIQIPQPKSMTDGVAFEQVSRNASDFIRWYEWVLHSIDIYKTYTPKPLYAPRYTHSCNRYFHPCQFIPFCTMPREEQASMMEHMTVQEWSPLDHHGEQADNSAGET